MSGARAPGAVHGGGVCSATLHAACHRALCPAWPNAVWLRLPPRPPPPAGGEGLACRPDTLKCAKLSTATQTCFPGLGCAAGLSCAGDFRVCAGGKAGEPCGTCQSGLSCDPAFPYCGGTSSAAVTTKTVRRLSRAA